MRRSTVWVRIAATCAIIVAGLILTNQPDDIESLLIKDGKVRKRHADLGLYLMTEGDFMVVTARLPEQRVEDTTVFKNLSRQGWTKKPGARMPNLVWFNMEPPAPSRAFIRLLTYPDHSEVDYIRPARPAEVLLHRLRAAIGLEE
jgi:hypothetical protein